MDLRYLSAKMSTYIVSAYTKFINFYYYLIYTNIQFTKVNRLYILQDS